MRAVKKYLLHLIGRAVKEVRKLSFGRFNVVSLLRFVLNKDKQHKHRVAART